MDRTRNQLEQEDKCEIRTDVASMCKLGFDLGLKELNADEQTFLPKRSCQLDASEESDSGW
mgnify:CR=1 FL=1